eukprot:scaffold49704_cov54-Attheya_sp.AAC.2
MQVLRGKNSACAATFHSANSDKNPNKGSARASRGRGGSRIEQDRGQHRITELSIARHRTWPKRERDIIIIEHSHHTTPHHTTPSRSPSLDRIAKPNQVSL